MTAENYYHSYFLRVRITWAYITSWWHNVYVFDHSVAGNRIPRIARPSMNLEGILVRSLSRNSQPASVFDLGLFSVSFADNVIHCCFTRDSRVHEATPRRFMLCNFSPFDNAVRNFKPVGSHGRTQRSCTWASSVSYKGLADESFLTGNFWTREKECHSVSVCACVYERVVQSASSENATNRRCNPAHSVQRRNDACRWRDTWTVISQLSGTDYKRALYYPCNIFDQWRTTMMLVSRGLAHFAPGIILIPQWIFNWVLDERLNVKRTSCDS